MKLATGHAARVVDKAAQAGSHRHQGEEGNGEARDHRTPPGSPVIAGMGLDDP